MKEALLLDDTTWCRYGSIESESLTYLLSPKKISQNLHIKCCNIYTVGETAQVVTEMNYYKISILLSYSTRWTAANEKMKHYCYNPVQRKVPLQWKIEEDLKTFSF